MKGDLSYKTIWILMVLFLEIVAVIIFLEWCFVSIFRYIFRKDHIPFKMYFDKKLPSKEEIDSI